MQMIWFLEFDSVAFLVHRLKKEWTHFLDQAKKVKKLVPFCRLQKCLLKTNKKCPIVYTNVESTFQ